MIAITPVLSRGISHLRDFLGDECVNTDHVFCPPHANVWVRDKVVSLALQEQTVFIPTYEHYFELDALDSLYILPAMHRFQYFNVSRPLLNQGGLQPWWTFAIIDDIAMSCTATHDSQAKATKVTFHLLSGVA